MNKSANYYCTWNVQNFGRPDAPFEKSPDIFLGAEGAKKARNFLNEENIFQSGGLADQYESVRDQLYFLLDDGWDVPYGVHPDQQITAFGSLELARDRFPSFTGTPARRLLKINDAFKKKGWRGAGLWVAAQAKGESYETGFLNREESIKYWSERINWCKEAGIEYWKVDWGCRQFDPEWRNMINELRDKLMPSLHIEHCHPAAAPVNHVVLQNGKQISDGRFATWEKYPQKWCRIMELAEIFRSYDVLSQFSQVSTVDRLATLMTMNPEAGTIINSEDEVYLGAVMGCSLGIMRSGLCKEIPVFRFDPQRNSQKTNEAVRAVNWQRIAPAFPINAAKACYSSDTIRETYTFEEGETWMPDYIGCEIFQECPGVITRGMKIPDIRYFEEMKPIVAASRHPNGAIAAVSMPRKFSKNDYRTPKAGITLQNIETGKPVGIFGQWQYVSLVFPEKLADNRVFIRDLVKEDETEITNYVSISDHEVTVSADLMERITGVNKKPSDLSDPGLVFYIR